MFVRLHCINAVASVLFVMLFAYPAWSQETPETETKQEQLEMPALLDFVQAAYPDQAEADGIEGIVLLEIDIDVEGNVEHVRVLQSAGFGFDEAALKAARQFRFQPARLDDVPVPARITYTYGFKLEPKPKPVAEPEPPGIITIAGLVLERGTRAPLAGVTVTVHTMRDGKPVGFETETKAEGTFMFIDLEPGLWSIIIESPGYIVFETQEQIVPGKRAEVIYYIERTGDNPYDIRVEGKRVRKEVTQHKIATSEIERVPGVFGDPVNVVNNLPGVARAAFGDGDIVVRGSSDESFEAYVEGAPILALQHFGGLRSVIPAGMLETIDFYPGNFSARYGQKSGGVLDVRLKELRPDAVHGYLDVNLFDAGAYVEAPIGEDAAIAIGARRSYIDVVLGSLLEDDSFNLVRAPRYYDGQVLVSWRPTPAHKLRLFALGTDDRFEFVSKNAKDDDTRALSNEVRARDSFAMFSLFDEYTPNTRLTNKIQVGSSLFTGDNAILGLRSKVSLNEVFLREELTYTFSDHVEALVGIDARAGKGVADLLLGDLPQEGEPGDEAPLDNIVNIKADKWFFSGGLFVETELKPHKDLVVVPGLRLDMQRWTQELTLDPRLNSRYDLVTDTFAIKGGVGLYHQHPQIENVLEEWGNPDLESERAIHYSAGFEWQLLDHLLLDITGFFNDLDNLAARTDAVVTRDGQSEPLLFDNSGRGRTFGLELLLRHNFANNFFGWIAYTLSRSERINPETGEYRLFDGDQTHILTAVGSYRLPWNMELGVRWRLVSGNPTTQITGATLDSDLDQYVPLYDAVNSSRKPMFHQLDIKLDKRWVFDTWMLTTYLDVQNIYNRANVEGYDYNFDYSQRAASQGLPILPALGIKAEF